MKQVREVAFDAEDCIDTFWCYIGHHYGARGVRCYCVPKVVYTLKTLKVRNNLAIKIQSLRTRVQRVSERRLRYMLNPTGSLSSSNYIDQERRLSALNIDESRLVGMADKTEEVTKLLDEGHVPNLKVVSVVGFGGLGKTTLAMTVYKSPAVKGIQSRAFVAVSQNYDPRALLESLLKQLIQRPFLREPRSVDEETSTEDPLKGIETWDICQLINRCRNYLENKRYFIVLHDLWRPEAWMTLKIAFPDNDKRSRILITTRNHLVAQICCYYPHDCIYSMEPLPSEESRHLFFKRVFKLDKCPSQYQDLVDISDAILRKCNGLPLAIVSIGGMLARMKNKTYAEWQKVCDRLDCGLEINNTVGGMRKILSLGYNDLPYHLKACFLYLSVFPEDFEIKRGPLIRRWAAEGFIGRVRGSNLEEIADKYFDEFISRNIVTPIRIDSSGEVRSCRVHDIMLEVISAISVQENFISLLGNYSYSITGHDKIRRLSIHVGGGKEQDFSCRNLSHLRSLTILGCKEKPIPIALADLTLLRVLDLEGCGWLSDSDLKDICKLYLLRYVSLRSTNISKLPRAVGNLKELLTLDVRSTYIRELPATITQLRCLKHLLAGRYKYYTRTHHVKHFASKEAVTIPAGLKNMSALQSIAPVNISSSFRAMHELGELSQLTKLCAINRKGVEKWRPFATSLSKLSNSLRHLSVIHIDKMEHGLEFLMDLSSPPLFLKKLYFWGRVSALPPWISSLSNLVRLSLRENYLESELVKILGKLHSLLSLKLYVNSYLGTELCFEHNLFPRLKQLMIDNLKNLDELSFKGGAPDLERLTLAFVKAPERGISGIENLPKLKEVEFFGIIVDSVVEGVIAAAKIHPNHPRVYRDETIDPRSLTTA
ncbi:putative NBS-LRR disease resistance protein [Oryza sativa Japonica Group]|uniref:NBS-LRR disease resistance protein n=1 Tax=Oryza sativa subsp. japonica TaxID=39947 RepID=Q5NBI5_ORYSJ|nr:putative NBS-LRR disease resistance protein [Oryza sativa Japonica Group]BAF04612.1 Os01g0269500 [Oryza sativa Japonica Group]|eukprot:NP_001042698.1 Os01g0269500 [Oryza sativa Japonica Group]